MISELQRCVPYHIRTLKCIEINHWCYFHDPPPWAPTPLVLLTVPDATMRRLLWAHLPVGSWFATSPRPPCITLPCLRLPTLLPCLCLSDRVPPQAMEASAESTATASGAAPAELTPREVGLLGPYLELRDVRCDCAGHFSPAQLLESTIYVVE